MLVSELEKRLGDNGSNQHARRTMANKGPVLVEAVEEVFIVRERVLNEQNMERDGS